MHCGKPSDSGSLPEPVTGVRSAHDRLGKHSRPARTRARAARVLRDVRPLGRARSGEMIRRGQCGRRLPLRVRCRCCDAAGTLQIRPPLPPPSRAGWISPPVGFECPCPLSTPLPVIRTGGDIRHGHDMAAPRNSRVMQPSAPAEQYRPASFGTARAQN